MVSVKSSHVINSWLRWGLKAFCSSAIAMAIASSQTSFIPTARSGIVNMARFDAYLLCYSYFKVSPKIQSQKFKIKVENELPMQGE